MLQVTPTVEGYQIPVQPVKSVQQRDQRPKDDGSSRKKRKQKTEQSSVKKSGFKRNRISDPLSHFAQNIDPGMSSDSLDTLTQIYNELNPDEAVSLGTRLDLLV